MTRLLQALFLPLFIRPLLVGSLLIGSLLGCGNASDNPPGEPPNDAQQSDDPVAAVPDDGSGLDDTADDTDDPSDTEALSDAEGPSDGGAIADAGRQEPTTDTSGSDLGAGSDATAPAVTIRIMAANISSGNKQSYDPGHGKRIFEAFDPDLVMIQEFNYKNNSDKDIAGFVAETFGEEFSYFREEAVLPNGVISRYPMVDAGEWEDVKAANRDFAWALIDLPGDTDLWAVSVHFLTSKAGIRSQEAEALKGYISAHVPASDFVVIGGDFNTNTRGEGTVGVLSDVVITAKPYPQDQDGNGNTNKKREKPYDWLVANPGLAALEIPEHIGGNTFPHGLVFDSRVYTPLSDLAPVLEGDSGASGMQHMAVIRRFQIQP